MIGYAAPRFLLPAYALLAIPVADALLHLATASNGRWRPATAAVIALGLAGHLAVQYVVLDRTVDRTTAGREAWARSAAALHRLGVRPPCLLTGHEAIPLAYYTGCGSVATRGHNANTTTADILRTAGSIPVGALTDRGGKPARYARDWELHRLVRLEVRIAPEPGAGGRP